MRVDKYLSRVGLLRRTEFKKNSVTIKINGHVVKPSKTIKVGDVIECASPTFVFKIEVLEIPEVKSVAAVKRKSYYRIIEKTRHSREIKSDFIKWLLED